MTVKQRENVIEVKINNMKYLNMLLLMFLTNCVFSQSADFSAYSRITDPDFQVFIDLFPEGQLPVSSENIRQSDLIKPSVPNIPSNMEERYFKINGEYIVPELYTLEIETGSVSAQYGVFQPVFKLPTTGDYVLLVIYQWDARSEWMNRTLVLSYDLAGNFIKVVGPGYLTDGAAPFVNTSINVQLEFSHTYITDASGNRSDFFQCKPCDKSYKTDTYQIQTSGQDSLVSSVDHGVATFKYVPFYFKIVE